MVKPVYRTTEAGRSAWESQDSAVPADYRFILWLIDFHGHDYIRKLVTGYPVELLPEWLGEMEQLGLIERASSEAETRDLVARPDSTAAFSEKHLARLNQAIEDAGASLSRLGAFLAEHRLKDRPPLHKTPAETVILIVEDDPDQLALADLRVTMAGYSVRVANSLSALQQSLANEGTPDLLLLDVMLPDGDGFEVLEKLRRHHAYDSLPVVMLTAKTDPADIGKGLRLGADGYLTKPYTKTILAHVVSRVLKQQSL